MRCSVKGAVLGMGSVLILMAAGCAGGQRAPSSAVQDSSVAQGEPGESTGLQITPAGPGRWIVTAVRRLGSRVAEGEAAVRAHNAVLAQERGRVAVARAWQSVAKDASEDGEPAVAIQAAGYALQALGQADAPAVPPQAAAPVAAPPALLMTPGPAADAALLLGALDQQMKSYEKEHFSELAE